MRKIEVKVYDVVQDGLPDPTDFSLIGRVAFIGGGGIISGTPVQVIWEMNDDDYPSIWQIDQDVTATKRIGGVTHWVEFPAATWELHLQ
jgi:hypothetical protein